jgi:hypothetical protein
MGLHGLLQGYNYLSTQRMIGPAVKPEMSGSNLGVHSKYPHNYWVFGRRPTSGILKARKHSVLATEIHFPKRRVV